MDYMINSKFTEHLKDGFCWRSCNISNVVFAFCGFHFLILIIRTNMLFCSCFYSPGTEISRIFFFETQVQLCYPIHQCAFKNRKQTGLTHLKPYSWCQFRPNLIRHIKTGNLKWCNVKQILESNTIYGNFFKWNESTVSLFNPCRPFLKKFLQPLTIKKVFSVLSFLGHRIAL